MIKQESVKRDQADQKEMEERAAAKAAYEKLVKELEEKIQLLIKENIKA